MSKPKLATALSPLCSLLTYCSCEGSMADVKALILSNEKEERDEDIVAVRSGRDYTDRLLLLKQLRALVSRERKREQRI